MPTAVERATVQDLEVLAGLFDDYRRFYSQPGDLDGARAFLRERLERGESVVFLARLEGEPAGFTQLYPIFTSVGMRRKWLLNDLFVAPFARRGGVGGALLERAAAHARETGASGLMLETATDNLAAQALYGRLGWRRDEGYYVYALDL